MTPDQLIIYFWTFTGYSPVPNGPIWYDTYTNRSSRMRSNIFKRAWAKATREIYIMRGELYEIENSILGFSLFNNC